jgi:hypothetical protein
MYRSWSQMKEGWTKNLATLFKHPVSRAVMLLLFWVFSWTTFVVGIAGIFSGQWQIGYYVLPLFFLYGRILWGRFPATANVLALIFGIPVAAFLLVNSVFRYKTGVDWKGRTYPASVGKRLTY